MNKTISSQNNEPDHKDKDEIPSSGYSNNLHSYEPHRCSAEYFYPEPTSDRRQATAKSAIFILTSTAIGGGILILPFAFDKCGIILATVFSIVSAFASDFSLYILVSCSRRSGARSYEDVAKKAFGNHAEIFVMILLFFLTYMAFVGYVIMVRDLLSSLMGMYIAHAKLSSETQTVIAIVSVLFISPIMLLQSIHALRFNSVFSFFSILILALGITYRSVQEYDSNPYELHDIKWLPDSWLDAMYGFPIISASYLCHFNMLPLYGELHKPTRRRLKKVVHLTMASAWIFYMTVGVMGYLYAFEDKNGVHDNILNNFDDNDNLINIGRAGLVITILLSMPLMMMPCRQTTLNLISIVIQSTKTWKNPEAQPLKGSRFGERKYQLKPLQHVCLTYALIFSALWIAFSLPGLGVLWSIMGSSVGLTISYILPTISYIYIRKTKSYRDTRKLAAAVLFIFSTLACIFCTTQAILALQ